MIEPVLSVIVTPNGKDDELKLTAALSQLQSEDKTLQRRFDPSSGKLSLLGVGELHLDGVRRRLRQDFGVRSEFGAYEVFRRETIRTKARQIATFSRESAGRRQYAQCVLEFEPSSKRDSNEFVSAFKRNDIPARYAAAVESGVREALHSGMPPGYPIIGVKVTLAGGESREQESDEAAFKIAGGMAVRSAYKKMNPAVLEPFMKCEVSVPAEYTNTVVDELNSRRARNLEVAGQNPQRVKCTAPLSSMLGYAEKILAITSQTASFVMEPSHFEERL